jgi:hypothetical protein
MIQDFLIFGNIYHDVFELMLEEFNPKIMHIKGIDNDAADALSRFNLSDKENDLITYEIKDKRLEYINPKQMNMCLFLSESNFEDDGFNDDILSSNDNYCMSMKQSSSSFPLDLLSMKEEQLKDDKIISIVSKHTFRAVSNLEAISPRRYVV